ncbi:helix-turn-helix domain-containing protein [Ekhidna sp.]|uniref:helix-turn-helix domain-containing protein n=1 Tax=Ekhidna sp. TaxID=2608089 RepID=UPI0032975EA7
MADFLHPENDFLQKVIAIIEENLADEHFEVPDLAQQLNMSRSNLLRKVKSLSGLSVSVFIRQVRLHHAKQLLRDDSLTISEVSFKVGFNSTSYFTKCFRETFGYPPGEEKSQIVEETDTLIGEGKRLKAKWLLIIGSLIAAISLILMAKESTGFVELDKSIAVLPFKNDSNDSSNVYIINGLMETILDNLQKIEDLDVTSRTTVEKYRGVVKTIPELSRELNVSYFVEGSGQKIGNQILLTIQLIDAKNDRHIWSQQYEREASDIFKIQQEVAKKIAVKIQAIVTPEERKRIEKIPTENAVAYDNYLKGLDLTKNMKTPDGLDEAISYFEKAIVEDPQFALAHAYIAICYYYLDIFQVDKQYSLEINTYADKALLFDEELPESLIAKALFYMQDEQYELSAKFFDKVLSYSPNSGWVHNRLSDIYADYIPNTEQYLKHAIQGIQYAISDQDSVEASYTYLHLGNALVETGFINESEQYIQKSLMFNPENRFSEYLYIYLKLAQNFNLKRTRQELISLLEKDTMRLDIIQEIGKVSYTMEEYDVAWEYYKKFLRIKEMFNLDIYNSEDIHIAYVLERLGRKEEADGYYQKFLTYAENDPTIYHDLNMCSYFAAKGEVETAMEYFKSFTDKSDYFYWLILFLDKDPIILKLSDHDDFNQTLKTITENFWIQHMEMRKLLEEEGVI